MIAVGLGALIYGRLSERLLRLEQRRHAVAFEARDLGRVAADNLRAQGTVEGIRAELERLEHAGNLGLPLERTLRDALTAFDRDAALLSLSADSTDGRVLLGGVTESDPVASVLHLERVRAALVERGGYTAVEVGSPTPFGSDGALLNFSVRAQRSGGVPDPLAPGGRERAR